MLKNDADFHCTAVPVNPCGKDSTMNFEVACTEIAFRNSVHPPYVSRGEASGSDAFVVTKACAATVAPLCRGLEGTAKLPNPDKG